MENTVFEFDNVFEQAKYPELQNNQELASIIKSKIEGMRVFMDKMKGGVRTMRSSVDFDGKVYKFTLSI